MPNLYLHIGLTQVIKEATRATAETNTLTYYIVTNKKDNTAGSGIIPGGITVIMNLFKLSGMPSFLKLIRIQKLLESEVPKT